MKNLVFCVFLIAIILGVLSSCADDQNFEQFDDLSVEPTVASSIFYFESDEATINFAGSGAFYSEVFTFEAFNEAFVSENVLDGVITYEVENTTTKELNITIDFLDADGNVLDSEFFAIQPAPAAILERQIAYGDTGRSLDILRNTTNIRVRGDNVGDATSTSSLSEPKIILRSSAEFRLKLR
ncbi:hypothetical protein [Croceitalea rosinachiae]|uniref:Uncharacterized protein n=1 Tax=Croceitalea rosinachiae TaxID=3075596 RepID=A0ABU3ADF7_9FLAO|nr:hypothetical protein [Croceitalea sp. F388]MDT0607920.1 hypothetical protein [Croceitalea sp. F388]